MGLKNVWNRALVYFGIAEEDEYWDEEYSAEDSLERSYADRPNVRRLHYSRRGNAKEDFDDWSEPEATEPVRSHSDRSSRPAVLGGGGPLGRTADARRSRPWRPSCVRVAQRVHLVIPRSFNDAQSIADKFKESVPVILNLQSADADSRSA